MHGEASRSRSDLLVHHMKPGRPGSSCVSTRQEASCNAGRWPSDAALLLDPLLAEGHKKVAITSAECVEARCRREMLAVALKTEFRGQVYATGSLVHGDAMTPLNDFDVGILVADAGFRYGLGGRGPDRLVERARGAILAALRGDFPGSTVAVEGQKRSILVDFGIPSNSGHGGFSADVIVALPNPDGRGILIPDLFRDRWDRSDPKTHADMVHDAVRRTGTSLIEFVRLAKYWSRHHDIPICSWNIKALALACATPGVSLTEAVHRFFHTAAQDLTRGLTPDPAGVAPPIRLELPRDEVILKLGTSVATVDRAIRYASLGARVEAVHELSSLFPNLLSDAAILAL